jgi:hypothetical protein
MLRLSALALLLLACACYSASLLQEPVPLAPGKARFGVGMEVGYAVATPSVSLRYGVLPRTELRAKVALGGGEAGVNVLVLDRKWLDVMLMPHYFSYRQSSRTVLRGAGLPLVFSTAFTPDDPRSTRVFIAPDVRLAAGMPARWFGLGVHVGASFQFSRIAGLVPECALFHDLRGRRIAGVFASDEWGSVLPAGQRAVTVSCGLGVTIGDAL